MGWIKMKEERGKRRLISSKVNIHTPRTAYYDSTLAAIHGNPIDGTQVMQEHFSYWIAILFSLQITRRNIE